MSAYPLIPHVGVGVIMFNESRASARWLLGVAYEVEAPPNFAQGTDHFVSLGVSVHYDALDNVMAVELMRPAGLLLDGLDLLKVSRTKAITWVASRDPKTERREDGFVSGAFGLRGYSPEPLSSDERLDRLMAFKPEYVANISGQKRPHRRPFKLRAVKSGNRGVAGTRIIASESR